MEHLANAILFAVQVSKIILANDGWYDAQCLGEVACHGMCGNMNILGGLLAARRLVSRHEKIGTTLVPYYFRDRHNRIYAVVILNVVFHTILSNISIACS